MKASDLEGKTSRLGGLLALLVLFTIILALTLVQLKSAPRWVHYEAEKK